MSIYTVRSKWDAEARKLEWLVIRGAAIIARKATESEARHTANGLRLAHDPWQAFEDARQARYYV